MRKWRVAKQDGAWQAWDTQGFLRYASNDFHLTLLFAFMGVFDKRRRGVFAPQTPEAWDAETSDELREALRRAIEMRIEEYKKNDGEDTGNGA